MVLKVYSWFPNSKVGFLEEVLLRCVAKRKRMCLRSWNSVYMAPRIFRERREKETAQNALSVASGADQWEQVVHKGVTSKTFDSVSMAVQPQIGSNRLFGVATETVERE